MKEFLQACNTQYGRWNRKKFWLYPMGLGIILFVPISVIISFLPEVGFILLGVAYIYVAYVQILSYIKRLRDLDKNPWMSVLMFVPLANIYLIIICGFFKGTEGPNKYGPDPLISTNKSSRIPKVKTERIDL